MSHAALAKLFGATTCKTLWAPSEEKLDNLTEHADAPIVLNQLQNDMSSINKSSSTLEICMVISEFTSFENAVLVLSATFPLTPKS